MGSLLITVSQVLILALEIGTGYVLAKRGKISADAVGILNYLCSNLALPCAIFLSAAGLELTADSWGEVRLGVALIIASAVVQIGVSTRLFRKERFEERVVYQLGTVYGNSAFMGIPIATAVIGDEAVLYVVLLMIIDTVCLFIHSSLAASGQKPTARMIAAKVFGPVTISLLLGLAVCLLRIPLPGIINTGLNDFRGILTPLAMLIIGAQLAEQDLLRICREKLFYKVAGVKLVVWPAILLLCFLPLRGVVSLAAVGAIMICKGTPQAAILGVLAKQHGLDGEKAAGLLGLTTVLSVVTLPVITGVTLVVFGV